MNLSTTVNKAGFSLIEVLIAMMIFSIGMLALAKAQLSSQWGNFKARSLTEATTLAQEKMEELKIIPFSHESLVDTNSDGTKGMDNQGPTADHNSGGCSLGGRTFDVFWNIADDYPLAGAKTIRVIVQWMSAEKKKKFSLSFIRIRSGI